MDGHSPNITYNIHGCPIEHKPEDPTRLFSSKGITLDIPRIGWIISGCFTFMSIVTSFVLIYRHCQYYTNPNQQRYIVRILLMVPIYATTSWFSYVYVRESVYYESIRTLYEAFVVASFFILMLQYLGATLADQKRVLKTHQRTKRWLFPLCCMKYNPSRLHFLQFMKWGILQYVPLKVFTTFLAIVLEAQGTYCEESWSPKFGHVWVLVIDFTAVSISTYFLIMFYVTIHKDLKKYQPLLKFLAIKLVIFFSFWQMVAIEGLVYFNVIKESQYWTTSNIATGLNAFIIDIEMFGFALLHLKAFSYKPYVPRKPIPPKDKSPLGDDDNKDPSSIPLSRLGSMDNIDLEKNDPRSSSTTKTAPGTRRGRRPTASESSQHQDPRYQKYPDLSSPNAATVASTKNAGELAGYRSRREVTPKTSGNNNNKNDNSGKEDQGRDKIAKKKKSKAPERLPTKAEREALMDYEKTTPVYRGLVDAFNPLDTIRELWYGMRYLYRWSRGLPVDRDHQRLMDLETAFGRLRPEPGFGKKGKDSKDAKKNKKSKKKRGKGDSEDNDEDDDEDMDEKKRRKKNKNKKGADDSDDDDDNDDDDNGKKKRKKKKGDGTDGDYDDESDEDDDDSDSKSFEDAYTIDDGDSSRTGDESDPDNVRNNPNTHGYASKKERQRRDGDDSPGHSGSGQGGGMSNKERMEEKAKLVVVNKKGVEYLPMEAASRTELAHVPSIKLKPVRKKELLSGLYAAHPHLRTSSGAQQELDRRRNIAGDEGRPPSPLSRSQTPDIPMPHPLREPPPRSSLDREVGFDSSGRGTVGYDPYEAFGTPPFQEPHSTHRPQTRSANKGLRLAPTPLPPASDTVDDVDTNSSASLFYHSREASHSDPELHTLTQSATTANYSRHHDQYVEQLERLEKERQLYHFYQQQELWRQHMEQLEQEQLQEQQEAAHASTVTPQEHNMGGEVKAGLELAAATDNSQIPGQSHGAVGAMAATDAVAPTSTPSVSPMPGHPPPLPAKESDNNDHRQNNHPPSSSSGHPPNNTPRDTAQHQHQHAQPQPQPTRRREPVRRHSADSLESGGSIRDHRHDTRRRYYSPEEHRRVPPYGDPSSFASRKQFYQQLAMGQQDQGYPSRPHEHPSDQGWERERYGGRHHPPPLAAARDYDPLRDRPHHRGAGGGGPHSTWMPYPPAPAALPRAYHHDHPASYGRPRDDYYDAGGYDPSAYDPRIPTHRRRYGPSPPPAPLRLPSSMPTPYGGRGDRYGSSSPPPPAGPSSPETLFPVSRYAAPHLREYEYQQWLEQQQQGRGRSDNGPSGFRDRRRHRGDQEDLHLASMNDPSSTSGGLPHDAPHSRHYPLPNHRDYLPHATRRDDHAQHPPPHPHYLRDGHGGDHEDSKGKAPAQRFPDHADDQRHDLDRRQGGPYRERSPPRRQQQHVPYEHVIEMHRYHQDPAAAARYQYPMQSPQPPSQSQHQQQQHLVDAQDDYDGPYEEAVVLTRSTKEAQANH